MHCNSCFDTTCLSPTREGFAWDVPTSKMSNMANNSGIIMSVDYSILRPGAEGGKIKTRTKRSRSLK